MKSWRDIHKVHPAADLFPMLPEDELRKLGEDIKANGLKEKICFWLPGNDRDTNQPKYLLDGRNRLAAIELVTGKIPFDEKGYFSPSDVPSWVAESCLYESEWNFRGFGKEDELVSGTDPYAYVISRNIHRRHLTKEQQADLIVKVMKLKETGLAKTANPVKPRNEKGQLQGQSTKDPLKQAVVEEAKKHGISQRTAEKAIAKDKGPTQKKAQEKEPVRKIEIGEHLATHPGDLKKLTRSQLENENIALLQTIADLRSELIEAKSEQVARQLQNNFNSLRGAVEAPDWVKSCKGFVKKYHPDHNPNRSFMANEVMADFIPIWKGLPAWVKEGEN